METKNYSRRLAAAAGSLAGLTAGPMVAEAAVVHVSGSPVSLNINAPSGSSVTWDIDGDSVGEFRIWNSASTQTWTSSGIPQVFMFKTAFVASNTVAGGQGNGRGMVAPFSTDNVQALFNSDWVGASRTFGRTGGSAQNGYYLSRNALQSFNGQNAIGYDFNYGFRSNGVNMVGFRFDAGQGYRYGYAAFQWDLGAGTISINEWWYDDSGSAVHVVPEPNALALLAMGAAGIAAYRATRKSRPNTEVTDEATAA
jgi:hypothetical protein